MIREKGHLAMRFPKIDYARVAALLALGLPPNAGATAAEPPKPTRRRKASGGRPADSYRGFRRNVFFGRAPTGNTHPDDRAMWRART